MPETKLIPEISAISSQNPVGLRLRWGISTASKKTRPAGRGGDGDSLIRPIIWGRRACGKGRAPPPARGRRAKAAFGSGCDAGKVAAMNKPAIEEFFRRLAAQRPDPRSELSYINPYTLLVAVVLSAQATDASVNKATAALFAVADTPQKMLKLGEAGLGRYIRTNGLYNGKAKNIIALSHMLVRNHGGEVPCSREALEALPGVGRKTANVVLNVAFGEPTIAVDTHIFRVGTRTGLARGKTPRAVEDKLVKVVPKKYLLHAHHWLILHGRYICTARKPKCPECPVRKVCEYKAKSTLEDFPMAKPKRAARAAGASA